MFPSTPDPVVLDTSPTSEKGMDMLEPKCFACGKPIRSKKAPQLADCEDDQKGVQVGPDCYRHIVEQAEYAKSRGLPNPGYLPASGGPALFPHNPLMVAGA